jgi:hypothetical protein
MTTQGVVLAPIYGATEFGGPTYMSRRPGGTENDWEWMSIDERTGIRWEPQGDGTYECQFIVRQFYVCFELLHTNNQFFRPDQREPSSLR